MTLKDILRKKHQVAESEPPVLAPPPPDEPVPEFTFVRTTTGTEELIHPPSFASDHDAHANPTSLSPESAAAKPKRFSHFRRSSSKNSISSNLSTDDEHEQGRHSHEQDEERQPGLHAKKDNSQRRLSQRLEEKLHIGGGSRSRSASSSNIPLNLPDAPEVVAVPPKAASTPKDPSHNDRTEAEWEKRATLLARGNQRERSRSVETREPTAPQSQSPSRPAAPAHTRKISGIHDDATIQEAIRLHETGSLTASTGMFRTLASPTGENNALSQVLYGLALRHGWGIPPDPSLSLHYLTLAATNSAAIESAALSLGQSKGGAAKGELILAIYELANSFRQGWGVQRDPVAARMYYETAANLGDTDAMGEVAWCYLEGFGGGKDKWRAAQYLRRAEGGGVKGVGNSWIWKPKYDPKPK
ncbi:MAG: hypothetical protein M1828_002586 [Chrysothrix sp. TS-e1954]|nr:MAG: hypothetical protein M1828_002586 [Chrysothrix sp. TS-e1954]